MKRFIVTVYREWKEQGTIEVEAEDEEEAREIAEESINSDDAGIEWDGSNMEPGNQGIESCVKS